jgi:hypothetical protein
VMGGVPSAMGWQAFMSMALSHIGPPGGVMIADFRALRGLHHVDF